MRIAKPIARDPATLPAPMTAVQMILDRGYGKPVLVL
jgi:hypothetical protein